MSKRKQKESDDAEQALLSRVRTELNDASANGTLATATQLNTVSTLTNRGLHYSWPGDRHHLFRNQERCSDLIPSDQRGWQAPIDIDFAKQNTFCDTKTQVYPRFYSKFANKGRVDGSFHLQQNVVLGNFQLALLVSLRPLHNKPVDAQHIASLRRVLRSLVPSFRFSICLADHAHAGIVSDDHLAKLWHNAHASNTTEALAFARVSTNILCLQLGLPKLIAHMIVARALVSQYDDATLLQLASFSPAELLEAMCAEKQHYEYYLPLACNFFMQALGDADTLRFSMQYRLTEACFDNRTILHGISIVHSRYPTLGTRQRFNMKTMQTEQILERTGLCGGVSLSSICGMPLPLSTNAILVHTESTNNGIPLKTKCCLNRISMQIGRFYTIEIDNPAMCEVAHNWYCIPLVSCLSPVEAAFDCGRFAKLNFDTSSWRVTFERLQSADCAWNVQIYARYIHKFRFEHGNLLYNT